MNKRLSLCDVLCGAVIFFFTIGILLMPIFFADANEPHTLIGREGLLQVRDYCIGLLVSNLIPILAVPLGMELIALLRRKMEGEATFSLKWRIPISIGILILYYAVFPYRIAMEMQTREYYKGKPALVRAAMLLHDVCEDLNAGGTQAAANGTVKLESVDYTYTYTSKTGRFSHETKTGHEMEHGLFAKNGDLIGQVSAADKKTLSDSLFPYLEHEITVYPNSKLIASIDGVYALSVPPLENTIELTYDYDAGVIRRDLLCENEDELPEMYLCSEMDVEGLSETEHGGKEQINNKTALAFKPMVPGTARAWVEIRLEKGGTQRISNIIEYTQTEHVAEPLPERGKHVAVITQKDGKNLLTDETYHFTLTYPAEVTLTLIDREAEDTGFGTDRDLALTEDNPLVYFGLYALERPWSKSYSEANEVMPGIESEMGWRKHQFKDEYTLIKEERRGKWYTQEWKVDNNTTCIEAMYPLTDLQYLEARFLYADADGKNAARAVMDSITVTP